MKDKKYHYQNIICKMELENLVLGVLYNKRGDLDHINSLAPPLLIEMPVASQVIE
jgi:hypothetical protein